MGRLRSSSFAGRLAQMALAFTGFEFGRSRDLRTSRSLRTSLKLNQRRSNRDCTGSVVRHFCAITRTTNAGIRGASRPRIRSSSHTRRPRPKAWSKNVPTAPTRVEPGNESTSTRGNEGPQSAANGTASPCLHSPLHRLLSRAAPSAMRVHPFVFLSLLARGGSGGGVACLSRSAPKLPSVCGAGFPTGLCPFSFQLSTPLLSRRKRTVFPARTARPNLSTVGWHLPECLIGGVEPGVRVVDFCSVFTLPLVFLREQARSSAKRLRLLPPYREHLSQAFARFFMRVGLPVDIPAFR